MKKVNSEIIFLHHSTGYGVWRGNANKYLYKIFKKGDVQKLLEKHNKINQTEYSIVEKAFPKREPYGWNNYPYDYYNIWVKNAGNNEYMSEPTLEILTKQYPVIVFKHCFPVSSIKEDSDSADINSEVKTIRNYKLQYEALKKKLHEFSETKFVLWTGAALTQASTTEEDAKRAKEFFTWVKKKWNEEGDNIFLWDFRELEVEGGLYLLDEYAASATDSHPNKLFNAKAAELFVNRLTDIIENGGTKTNLKGESI